MAISGFPPSFGIDLFADTAPILISIVSNSYYGMLRGQIHIETIEINMAAVSAKRSIGTISDSFHDEGNTYVQSELFIISVKIRRIAG